MVNCEDGNCGTGVPNLRHNNGAVRRQPPEIDGDSPSAADAHFLRCPTAVGELRHDSNLRTASFAKSKRTSDFPFASLPSTVNCVPRGAAISSAAASLGTGGGPFASSPRPTVATNKNSPPNRSNFQAHIAPSPICSSDSERPAAAEWAARNASLVWRLSRLFPAMATIPDTHLLDRIVARIASKLGRGLRRLEGQRCDTRNGRVLERSPGLGAEGGGRKAPGGIPGRRFSLFAAPACVARCRTQPKAMHAAEMPRSQRRPWEAAKSASVVVRPIAERNRQPNDSIPFNQASAAGPQPPQDRQSVGRRCSKFRPLTRSTPHKNARRTHRATQMIRPHIGGTQEKKVTVWN